MSSTRVRRNGQELHRGTELAHTVAGHVCLASAALAHGWKVKAVPGLPQIALPIEGLCTSAAKTLEMCGRRLPFDEALAIADSALRDGFPARELRQLADAARGPGSARLRRVAEHADHRAANPFESVLRAIALDVPGLEVVPQARVRGALGLDVRPDLVDRRLRVVLEADSFEWHGDRAALRRDARRYDLLGANGWLVLRFAWEDVMHDQDWVRSVLVAATGERTEARTRPAARA